MFTWGKKKRKDFPILFLSANLYSCHTCCQFRVLSGIKTLEGNDQQRWSSLLHCVDVLLTVSLFVEGSRIVGTDPFFNINLDTTPASYSPLFSIQSDVKWAVHTRKDWFRTGRGKSPYTKSTHLSATYFFLGRLCNDPDDELHPGMIHLSWPVLCGISTLSVVLLGSAGRMGEGLMILARRLLVIGFRRRNRPNFLLAHTLCDHHLVWLGRGIAAVSVSEQNAMKMHFHDMGANFWFMEPKAGDARIWNFLGEIPRSPLSPLLQGRGRQDTAEAASWICLTPAYLKLDTREWNRNFHTLLHLVPFGQLLALVQCEGVVNQVRKTTTSSSSPLY